MMTKIDLSSTSTRTFLVWPVALLVRAVLTRRVPDARLAPLGVLGYLVYRGAGTYRTRQGGGGPGMGTPPVRIVESGLYAVTRNPMYLGHLLSYAAYAASTRSLFFAGLFGWHLQWFDRRAERDEARLLEIFGPDYERYREEVPRWLPIRPRSLQAAGRRLVGN